MKAPLLLLSVLAAAGCATAPSGRQSAPALSAARILEDVRILSSDAFQGRGPAQPGEQPTLEYLVNAFSSAGLQPGGPNGSWYQEVELLQYNRAGPVALSYRLGGETFRLETGRDVTAASRIVGRTAIDSAPLVFVGYGVNAPQLGWNDYEGLDMRGKVAVILANDPDFEAESPGPFGGRTMSYYGRFGAKVEEAQRQGAVAVLVVHEDAPASYPWSQVANSDPTPGYGLAPAPGAAAGGRPFGLRGWLHRDRAVELFRRAGLDFEALKRAARSPGFRGVPIADAALSADFTTETERVTSRNVVARLPGTTHAGETILYGAHWDAYGIGAADGRGDRIRNGAIDNALGTATMLDIARAFARAPRTERSIVFVAYTAEEKGLLGAEYYAANPLSPLETTAAVFNLDPHAVLSAARNLDLIGVGRTDLETDLVRVAAAQGLRVEPESNPEAGWYFRSDHFAFAKRGVPTVYFRAGRDLVNGGRARGEALAADYNANRYHQTTDEFVASWDMSGAVQEGTVAYLLGRELANSRRWPSWNRDVEYRAVRETSAAARR
jgi:Zn-dependent M28 family amino/carboxypeptidase